MGWIKQNISTITGRLPRQLTGAPAVLISIYLLTLFVYMANGRSIAFVDTGPARHLALSLLRDQDLDLNEIQPHIDVLELGYTTRIIDGKLVSYYPVGTAFLAAPLYAVGMLIGIEADQLDGLAKLEKWAAANLGALLAVLYWVLLRRRTEASLATRIILCIAIVFGTSNWVVNSQGLWQHTPMQIFVVLALLSFPRNLQDRHGWWRAALCGLLLGLAGFMRPTAFILIPVWGSFLLWKKWRAAVAFGIGAVAGALPQLVYNLAYISDDQGGYFNLIFKGGFFTNLSPIDNALSLLLSPSRGFLIFSPFMVILFLWAFSEVRRRDLVKLPMSLIAISAMALFAIYLSFQVWWAGWTFGARFFGDMLPFLALLLVAPAQFLLSQKKPIAVVGSTIIAALVAWSVSIQALAAWRYDGGWDAEVGVTLYPDYAWDWSRNSIAYCVTGGQNPYVEPNAPSYYSVDPARIYKVGMRESAQFLNAGFHTQEGWGTWTRGVLPGTMLLHFPQGAGKLYINGLGTGSDYDPARYDFYLNGNHVDKELVHPNAFIKWESETLEIPLKQKHLNGGVERLQIVSRDPRRAAPTGRVYGLGIKEMLYVPDTMKDSTTSTVEEFKLLK